MDIDLSSEDPRAMACAFWFAAPRHLLLLAIASVGLAVSPVFAAEPPEVVASASTTQITDSESSQKAAFRGILLERGTQIPLRRVTVFLLPSRLRAETDDLGRFEFLAVPLGGQKLVVNSTGFRRLERDVLITDPAPSVSAKFFLEKEQYLRFESLVTSDADRRDQSRRSLKQEEFLNLPGAGGDPVKAVQNLPGVNRVAGFSSQVVIQGSAPGDTKYNIDGHDVPSVFHFGGLTSVVMPEAVDRVDYFSAGYGPEYSRALGGVIGLRTRDPQVVDRPSKGFFFADTLKAGGLWEGKLGEDSSLLVSGRYSYIGFVLRRVIRDNPSFDLTVAPEFSDITTVYNKKINERDSLRVVGIASRDTLEFLFREPVREDPAIRGNFSNLTQFVRLIPQWTRKVDLDRTARLSLGIGRDEIRVDVGDNYFDLKNILLTTRGEWEQNLLANWKTQVGFDNQYFWTNVALRLPLARTSGGVTNPLGSSEVRQVDVSSRIRNIGLYWRNEVEDESGWTYLPSLRLDRFSLTNENFASPRFAVRKKLSDTLLTKAATGLYVQPPQPQEVNASVGNENVKSPRAIHYTVGFEKDLRGGAAKGWEWSGSYFDRRFDQLVIQSSQFVLKDGTLQPELFNNNGKGRAFGLESLLKFEGEPWSGWLGYTFTRSTRWDDQNPEYPSQFDQTHNINLLVAREFPRNWKVSGRYRWVTGSPVTPVTGGVYDADADVYLPSRGPLYSERLSDFRQLDLRVDKKWILDTEIWSVYLDAQNVLSNRNPETIRYSFDYKVKEEVTGLPLLIALGIKGEF